MRKNPTLDYSNLTSAAGTAAILIGAVWLLLFASTSSGQEGDESSPNDFRKQTRRGPENTEPNMKKPGTVRMGLRSIEFPDEFRTIDGFGNNVVEPEWGKAEISFLRLTTVDYEDGVDSPSGVDRPNVRAISNAVCAQDELIYNGRLASDFLWQWGQFVDHDITLTPIGDLVEEFNIEVPAGDSFFDPQGTGTQEIGLDRSFNEDVDGIREQLNEITAFVDASNVYGSDEERAEALRLNDGSGKLKTSEGDLLPFNTGGLPNAPSADAPNFFLGGDFRANEQAGLTAMHTLFVREHNYWAEAIAKSNSGLDGDTIYEVARAIVGAEMQAITYREFIPLLLGHDALPRYEGYKEDVNPGISNVFATASYRFGHTMLSSDILRLDRRMEVIDEGNLSLADAFFNPTVITDEGGIEPMLRGLSRQPAQEIDTKLVDEVRNFLFGPPGAGGFDLASLNIQRGRDHGLPGYNEVRRNFGLEPAEGFDDITSDKEIRQQLENVYGDVELVDIWVGGLAEPHLRHALVGETVFTILRDQFLRLRDGDRFWYQNHLDKGLQRLIEQQTLAQIIRRNTDIGRELSDVPWIAGRPRPEFTKGDRLPTSGRPPHRRGFDDRKGRH